MRHEIIGHGSNPRLASMRNIAGEILGAQAGIEKAVELGLNEVTVIYDYMNQKKLSETLGGVVEDSVNKVGVDLNTASASLLEYISGISKAVAKNIIDYRETNGRFTNRKQLLKVAKLGPKAFEQCAGFMRISGGDNPLDATSVHPESYEAAKKLLEVMGYDIDSISSGELIGLKSKIEDMGRLADELGIGTITLEDIVKELEKPGRDPRDEMPKPILRKDVLDMKDLASGMILKGTVRNVIDFGAFVDIGVHQDGLVHISQMSAERRVEHPLDIVSVGDIVDVRVIDVDVNKGRISLSMILDEKAAANRGRRNSQEESNNKGGNKQHTKDNNSQDRNQNRKKKKPQGLNLRGLEKHAQEIKIPVLLCQAGKDYLVSNAAEDEFIAKLPQGIKKVYPDSKHEIFNADDDTLEKFYSDILDFWA